VLSTEALEGVVQVVVEGDGDTLHLGLHGRCEAGGNAGA
jgi:hypothetical protein